jgi:hypothetical protein
VAGQEDTSRFFENGLEGGDVVEGDFSFHHGVAAAFGDEDVVPPTLIRLDSCCAYLL